MLKTVSIEMSPATTYTYTRQKTENKVYKKVNSQYSLDGRITRDF